MKMFAATNKTQGKRATDFYSANEGEIVVFNFECDGEEVDGSCGCRRAMIGVDSHKGTTTFKIIESDWTLKRLKKVFIQRYKKNGFETDEAEELAEEMSLELAEAANNFSIGQIVERRGYNFQVRSI